MDEKYLIISRLANDEKPKDIAEALDVSYGKVLRVRSEFNQAKEAGTIDELVNMDQVMLDKLLNQAASDVPAELSAAADDAVANVSKAKGVLDAFQGDLVVTATYVTTRIKSMASSVDHVAEIVDLSDALCKLQTAFFNSNKTQVNIQNNTGGGASYGEFLSDQPKDL